MKRRVSKRRASRFYNLVERMHKRAKGWHGLLTHRVVFDREVAEAEQYGRHNSGDHSECTHG